MSVLLPECEATTPRSAASACCFAAGHRGTQEIDLIFGSFAERSADQLSTVQLDRFEALLDCNDADLFDWVTGRSTPPSIHDHDVMRMLRSCHCHQKV